MKAKYILLIVMMLCWWGTNAFPPQPQYYQLSKDNLLPSDNVYFALKDHLGYLWIATDKGVAKYNGYSTKLFNLDTRLANEDVWYLYEDNQARIWLGAIANEVGYIKNDKYQRASLSNRTHSFYPAFFTRQGTGITFTSTVEKDATPKNIYIEYLGSLFTVASPFDVFGSLMLSQAGCFALQRDSLYSLSVKNKSVTARYICKATNTFDPTRHTEHNFFNYCFNNYFITERFGTLSIVNLTDTSRQTLKFKDTTERIQNVYPVADRLYLISNYHIYTLDRRGKLRRIVANDAAQGKTHNASSIRFYKHPDYWGKLISFQNRGLQIGYDINYFKKADSLSSLVNGQYIGRSRDGSAHWFDNNSKTLTRLGRHTVSNTHIPHNVIKVTPVDSHTSLLITDSTEFWISNDEQAGITHYYDNYRIHTSRFHESKQSYIETPAHINTRRKNIAAIFSNGGYYLLNKANGFGYIKRYGDSIRYNNYSADRHTGLAYDSVHRLSWLYNLRQIKVFKDSNLIAAASPDVLSFFGITVVKQIEVHAATGNVFILGRNTLHVYNIVHNKVLRLLPSQNLSESGLEIAGDKLVLFGPFGIITCKIQGPLSFSVPRTLTNIKGIAYSSVISAQVDANSAILNTDKGVLIADISDSTLQHTPVKEAKQAYRFVAHTDNGIGQLNNNDTLTLSQELTGVPVDVINPAGSGTLHIMASVNGLVPVELENSTLNLTDLAPGLYHTVTLQASDDAWQSKPVTVTIYVEPYWWQSSLGKRLIFIGILFVLLLLLLMAIYLTKRVIDKRNMERSKTLEMNNLRLTTELKSLYAQINPHFIFNTLSTGLYFIKKKRTDEAYQHIIAFSDLLRGYLKSSRNKFISIAEEVTNLTNYILLQQSRFEDRFDFSIVVDNNINRHSTNIPTLLMQPLVENAINHGLLHKQGKGLLTISFALSNDVLTCTIDDDGVGREKARELKAQQAYDTTSYGSDLIKELIHALNTYEGMDISLLYIDKQAPLTGTTVIITIKHKKP